MLDFLVFNPFRELCVYECIWFELQCLPRRFHREFLQDVVVSVGFQSCHSIRKCVEYFLSDILDELSVEEYEYIFGEV